MGLGRVRHAPTARTAAVGSPLGDAAGQHLARDGEPGELGRDASRLVALCRAQRHTITFPRIIHHREVSVLYIYGAMTRPSPPEVIVAWAPRSLPPEAAAFARRVVETAAPNSPERAKALLFAAGKLAGFGLRIGLPLEEEALLRTSLVERFVCSPHAGSPPTRRTLRANLRHLARAVLVGQPPAPVAMPRERAKAPYSPRELAGYLALCDAQPTPLRRQRASALICLGAGAGLVGGELRGVRGEDVVSRSGGLLVLVAGRRPRAVPVLSDFHDRLVSAASFFGARYLVSGHNPTSHNVTNPLIRSLSGGADLPRLEPARLRSSYLVQVAETIGLAAFMDAAGISCSQRLGDLVSHVPSPSEEAAVALLGARSR